MPWLLFLLPVLAAAQPAAPGAHAHQLNGWYMYFGGHPVKGRWDLHLEGQWRRHDGILRWQQSLLRPGVIYQLNERVALSGGYAHIRTHSYGAHPAPGAFNEHRPWQQVLVTQRFGRVRWQHRMRQEQRWIQSAAAPEEWRYSNRFRYFGKGIVPMKGRWFGAFYNEVFVTFPVNPGGRAVDQNRAYGAIGRRIGRHNTVEFGYMYQVIAHPYGRAFEHNHTLQLALFSRAPIGR